MDKKRIMVTLTSRYLEGMDSLMREGKYLNRSQLIMRALQSLFKAYGLQLFHREVG